MAGAEKLWIMSNASLASVLPAGADPKAFLTRHMVAYNTFVLSILFLLILILCRN